MSNINLSHLSLNIFGASHAEKIGIEISGLPKGIAIDRDAIAAMAARRAPKSSAYSTSRREKDEAIFESGLLPDGTTDGSLLRAVIYNTDAHSIDYDSLRDTPRPGHADYTARIKYGDSADLRGGGAFSGRMTAPLCIAGAIAEQCLAGYSISVGAHIYSVGDICDGKCEYSSDSAEALRKSDFPVFDALRGEKMLKVIAETKENGDSVGGIIEAFAVNCPAGLGGELFDGLESEISALCFAVPAVKGVEFGDGFALSEMRGSQANDPFITDGKRIATATNHCGGILGGISDGMPIIVRAAIKPTPSIALPQQTVNLRTMTETKISVGGRHDACIVPRALPVIESCVAIALYDKILESEENRG